MNLLRLSRFSIVACLAGLVLLLALTVLGAQRLVDTQRSAQSMLELEKRIDDFSVASDNLILLGADEGLWQAYATEAQAIQGALEALGPTYPDALRAAQRVATLAETVGSHIGANDPDRTIDFLSDPDRPLTLSAADRIVMHQVAGQGIALDSALEDALSTHQRRMAREVFTIGGVLAGASLLFGILCIVAFGLIHGRIVRPAQDMAGTLRRVHAGNAEARAPVRGTDEMSGLAEQLNRTLDRQDQITRAREAREDRLRETLAELEKTENRLLRAQEIANLGGYDFDVESGEMNWSDQALEILGVQREEFGGDIDDFLQFVHESDREELRAARERWIETGRPNEFRGEYRIVRPDGEVRWIRANVRLIHSSDGRNYSSGTLQDVTDRVETDRRLRQMEEIVEGSEDLCYVIDESSRFVWANRAYRQAYALDAQGVSGLHLRDVIGADYFEQEIRARIDSCLAGNPQRFETRRELPGLGHQNDRQLLVRYYPIQADAQRSRLVAAVLTDVTQERLAQTELERRDRLLDMAGRTARFGAWSVDLQTNEVEWSDTVAEIHGLAPDEEVKLDEAIGFYAPEDRARITSVFQACSEAGTPYDEELQIVDRKGLRHWIRTIGEAVHDAEGRIVRVQGAFQDISGRKELELEREKLAERLADMVESITDGFVATDDNWRYTYINRHGARMIGKDRKAIVGEELWAVFPDLVGTPIEAGLREAMELRTPTNVEAFFEPLDTWFDVNAYPQKEGLAIFFRDVSDRHQMLERLKSQEEALRSALSVRQALINSLPAHIAMLDRDGTVVDVNNQWRHFGMENDFQGDDYGVGRNYLSICDQATGKEAQDASQTAQGLRELLRGEREVFTLEYPCHGPEHRRWFRLMINRLSNGGGSGHRPGAVAMHIDITERKEAERELNRLAYEDALTRSLSRHGFASKLDALIECDGWSSADHIAMFDIVDQHGINDVFGYETGDQLLIQISQRLYDRLGPNAIVGRTGGDEFVVHLPSGDDEEAAAPLEPIEDAFSEPFVLESEGEEIQVDIEIHLGYTLLDQFERPPRDLIREAELALYEARSPENVSRNRIAYSETLDRKASERQQLTRELREALSKQQFELHFQPKVNLANGHLISAEALLRWQHPERGLQPPGLFIPVAEQSQLIGPIGDWALREACRLLQEWRTANLDVVQVAVNVSQVQFRVGNFPAKVRKALDDFGVDPANLSLEITESVFENQSDQLLADIRSLSDMGVRLSLDDFGTGYSSLRYLQRYPFDEIKIDRSFVDNVLDDSFSRDIVNAVLDLARALEADVVAEGIESAEISRALLEMGCQTGQGFYYSVPLEAEDFRWLLDQRSALPL